MTQDVLNIDFTKLPSTPTPKPIPMISRGKVTVLKCLNGRAAKVFTPAETHDYSMGKFFDVETYGVNGIHDLARVIAALAYDPNRFIIRGIPIGVERSGVLRRSKGDKPTFKEAEGGGHWVCLDIDSGTSAINGTPEEQIRDWVERVPQLRDTSFVWQVSASWGIKPGIRAHLWFFLEEPRTESQVTEWAAGLPIKVDPALFRPIQPHYVAAPIFHGVADPMHGQWRIGLVLRREDSLYIPTGDVEGEIVHWEEAIQKLGDSGDPRHPIVNRAAFALGGWVGANILDASEVEARLVNACEMSGAFDTPRITQITEEIRRAIQDGSRNPRQMCGWRTALKVAGKTGAILPIPYNLLHIFRNHPSLEGAFGLDVRTNRPLVLTQVPWNKDAAVPRELSDNDDTAAAAWLNQIGCISSAITRISDTISVIAAERELDSVKTWLEELPAWDGVSRIDHWVPWSTGCPDDLYHREVGKRFLISMIARTFEPGCKCDYMLVLVGPQGSYKSTLLEVLASGPGKFYSDGLGDIQRPQDYIPNLQGPWLIEEGEMSNFNRREVDAVKRFLTVKTDRARLSYARRAIDIPRRCVFAGTSNPAEFLSDPTGNRRFWPVDVSAINLQWVKDNRDQLFAEALAAYRAGEKWFLPQEVVEAAADYQDQHTQTDPREDRIRTFLDSPPASIGPDFTAPKNRELRSEVTVEEILTRCLEKPIYQCGVQDSRQIGLILKRLGWVKTRVRRAGRLQYRWIRGQYDTTV